ncbi:glycosyltransferase [Escherichia coli]|nr:amylovoran biosynthesis protein AmsE [Escherichia coli]EFE62648.1 hypothetical protein ECCG_00538 [Escherichia coli B088]EJT2765105.1 glycosyltransferase [Shigella sonnei]EKH5291359.1 glycosyltransferase [Escherichia coli O26]EKH6182555.1 glycosyltransferase [Escherichia coli O111]EKH6191268.1 glycosyltransferase [Escherichia coli O103]EKJ1982896.1 glycosyltransferase [Escherichia coli O104]EKY3869172.1 glycosyltransferase [Escherichia coli O157]ELQ0209607.1 glycosyltransferase [Escheric
MHDKKTEEFSVLMSLYCNEKPEFLNQCLISIHEQSVKPNEIIIVYDGYIPAELDNVVIEWSKVLPVKVCKLHTNMGLGDALNFGIKHCNNELIARMDTDDICAKDRFKLQLQYFNENPTLTLIGGGIEEYDEEMQVLRGTRFTKEKHADIVKYACFKNPFNHMTVMFKKKDIQSVGGYKKHLLMEDYNLWLRLLNNGYKTYNLPEILVYARTGINMVRKRRGMSYFKSEIQLFKLKRMLNCNSYSKNCVIFLIRVLPRFLPVSVLSIVYKIMRK